jgi:hypothetical protein
VTVAARMPACAHETPQGRRSPLMIYKACLDLDV